MVPVESFYSGVTNLLLELLNRFIRGIIFPTTQQNLFISSKFILQILSLSIFHKRFQNVCHANYSRTASSFAMPSRLLGAPTPLNQMSFVGNFISGKFYSISKNVMTTIIQKHFGFSFTYNFLLITSTKIFITCE